MIKRNIEIEYHIRQSTGEVALNFMDLYNPNNKQSDECFDIDTRHHKFDAFKNNGKVSKTCASKYEIVNRAAEKALKTQLEIEKDCEKDQKRANQLSEIINNADFTSDTVEFVTIKEKTSHSRWYKSFEGELHEPSSYLTQVPKSVEKEARELQEIRRKHQKDSKFNFFMCDYKKHIVKIADHDNGDYSADEFYSSFEEFKKATLEKQKKIKRLKQAKIKRFRGLNLE